MDQLYSLTLLAALATAFFASLASVLNLRRSTGRGRPVAAAAAVVALLFGGLSFIVHRHFGHGPEAPEPMSIGRFLEVHPAYVVVLALSLFALCVWFPIAFRR